MKDVGFDYEKDIETILAFCNFLLRAKHQKEQERLIDQACSYKPRKRWRK